jgi:hypothetical protein
VAQEPDAALPTVVHLVLLKTTAITKVHRPDNSKVTISIKLVLHNKVTTSIKLALRNKVITSTKVLRPSKVNSPIGLALEATMDPVSHPNAALTHMVRVWVMTPPSRSRRWRKSSQILVLSCLPPLISLKVARYVKLLLLSSVLILLYEFGVLVFSRNQDS